MNCERAGFLIGWGTIAPAWSRLPWLSLALLAGGCPQNDKFADDPPEEDDTDSDTEVAVPTSYRATIRRTSFGVAHILADDLGSAGFGQGYAFAQDHACVLADQILKVRSQRAVFLGPGPNNAHVDRSRLSGSKREFGGEGEYGAAR